MLLTITIRAGPLLSEQLEGAANRKNNGPQLLATSKGLQNLRTALPSKLESTENAPGYCSTRYYTLLECYCVDGWEAEHHKGKRVGGGDNEQTGRRNNLAQLQGAFVISWYCWLHNTEMEVVGVWKCQSRRHQTQHDNVQRQCHNPAPLPAV